jgi:TolA-binding protein
VSENLKKLIGVVILAALVVLGVSTTRDIQSLSFERNSLSSGGSGQSISLPTAPTADKTSAVVDKIEAQIGKISDLVAEIHAIMEELQALELPQDPGEDATEQEIKKYQEQLANFQQKLSALNRQLSETQGKLAKTQSALAKLQNSELPQAQTQDTRTLKEWADESEEALKNQAKDASSSTQDDKDLTIGAPEEKVKLKPQDPKRSAAEVTSTFTECAYNNVGRPTDLDKKLRQAEKALPSKRVTTRRSLPELSKSAANIRLAECGGSVGDSTEGSDQSVGSVLLASCVNERVGSVRLRSHIQSAVRECLSQLPPMIRPGSSGNGNNAKADPDLKGDRRDREVEDDDPGQDGTTAENG